MLVKETSPEIRIIQKQLYCSWFFHLKHGTTQYAFILFGPRHRTILISFYSVGEEFEIMYTKLIKMCAKLNIDLQLFSTKYKNTNTK